jgi:hypothetical protein
MVIAPLVLLVGLMTAGCVGFGALLLSDGLPSDFFDGIFKLVGLLFVGVFFLFDLFLLLILGSLLSRRETWVFEGMVHHKATLLGFGSTKSIPLSSLTVLKLHAGSSMGGKPRWDIQLKYKRPDGRLSSDGTLTLATSVPTELEAEAWAKRVAQWTGTEYAAR